MDRKCNPGKQKRDLRSRL